MGTLLQDLRYGLRMLAKNPGFTAVAVLTLALGIGANTAMFSAIDGVLMRPLPFKDPGQLYTLWERNLKMAMSRILPRRPLFATGATAIRGARKGPPPWPMLPNVVLNS